MLTDFLLQNWTLVLAITIVIGLIIFESAMPSSGKAVDVTNVAQIVNHQQGVVLDIRDKADFEQGHIANSRNLPINDIENKLATIKKWKNKPIIVTCNTGTTAKKAIKTLKTNGFENVYLLTGGIQAWKREGFPLVNKSSKKA